LMRPTITVEKEIPWSPQAVAAAHREREIETAMLEEFGGPLPAVPVNPVKDVDMPSLAELLRVIAEAKLAGKTVWPCDDPLGRRVGFIVDEDDACYRVSLVALKEADLAVWKERADAVGLDVPEFKKAFANPRMRAHLFGNGDAPFNEPVEDDPDLDKKAAAVAAMAEAENAALAEQGRGDLGIPRPEGTQYVYDYGTGPNTKVNPDMFRIKSVSVKVLVEYVPADPSVPEHVLAAQAFNRELGETTFALVPETFRISQSRDVTTMRDAGEAGKPVEMDVGPTTFVVMGTLRSE